MSTRTSLLGRVLCDEKVSSLDAVAGARDCFAIGGHVDGISPPVARTAQAIVLVVSQPTSRALGARRAESF